jgi:energy-converting hydrogenase Eha subunit C
MLAIFKLLGGIALILPQIPLRIKEWAYAGFAIDFIAAFVSITVIDGANIISIFPLVALIILITSYSSYFKILKSQKKREIPLPSVVAI